jgi:hypothetical protein
MISINTINFHNMQIIYYETTFYDEYKNTNIMFFKLIEFIEIIDQI